MRTVVVDILFEEVRMAYFARRLKYAACDGDGGASFIALIELAKKKGGKAVSFFLYRYTLHYWDGKSEYDMIRLQEPTTAEEARCYFLFSEKSKFPGDRSPLWKKTGRWLYAVSVGGWHERFSPGTWVKVCFPSPWKKRHKKRPLQVGNPAHIILSREYQLRLILEEKCSLERERNDLESYSYETDDGFVDEADEGFIPDENLMEHARITQEITAVEEEIDGIYRDIRNLKDELRFKKARALGKRFFRRDSDGSLIIVLRECFI